VPELTPLEAAIVRGHNLPRESPRIKTNQPEGNNPMLQTILGAVLNSQEAILEKVAAFGALLAELQAGRPQEEKPPSASLVTKPCDLCGKAMIDVHPARKYCDECRGARK
jgi:hypothetical protein